MNPELLYSPFRRLVILVASLIVIGSGNTALAAGLLVADGGFGGKLEMVEHDVKVTVNNGIAVTDVTQVFHNMENRQVEALYTFPVPKGASVANFSMWINGKEMVGEVLEKERAREIYNSYKKKRRDPGLLEQKDFKTFEMRIFPIAADALQKVRIIYYQELDFDHNWATYVYPLATTSHSQTDSHVTGRFAVNFEVKSAIPIANMESPSHGKDFLIVDHTESYYEASLENQDGDLARDVVLAYKVTRPVTGLDIITSKQRGEDGYFMLTLTGGKELEKTQTGSDYVFILDISGSMANDGKLSTSINSIEAFIKALGEEDRFEVITFNKRPSTLFGSMQQADAKNIERALSFLKSQEARGGTLLETALTTAYKYGDPDRVLNTVILSDGMTEQQERGVLMRMIASRPQNVRVFCIGVGNEVNRSLLSQMAEDAGGLAAFISQNDNFTRQAQAFRRKLLHPVASNLTISFGGLEVYDVEPRTIPNLYYGAPIRLYGRYKNSGTINLQLSADVNGRRVNTEAEFDLPAVDENNPQIERMWAWHRMEHLKREHEITNSPKNLDEIVRLGELYSITSEYTSFLVLENESEYKRWKIERRNAGRMKRDGKAMLKLRSELETLRSKGLEGLGPIDSVKPGNKVSQQQPMRNSQQAPVQQPSTSNGSDRSFDLPRLGGGGGGAMDPVSGLIAVALAGGAFSRRRKK